MEKLTHIFKNNGLGEYNDDVFDYPAFNLLNLEYNILIKPVSGTRFWRFGIVLSQRQDFLFQPNKGRYKDNSLRFIQINVGDQKDRAWVNSNKLELQTYYYRLDDKPEHTFQAYQNFAAVEFQLKYNSENSTLYASIYTGELEIKDHPFTLEGYCYFKVFAWADLIAFEIECQISIDFKPKFVFPRKNLSEIEKKYLQIIYQNFLSGAEVGSAYSIPEIWNDLPRDFHPNQIDRLLVQNDRFITLWGIWHIDPESDIFQEFDQVVLWIRALLKKGGDNSVISSSQIQSAIPNITHDKILQIFQLMGRFPDFHRGIGKLEDSTSTIRIHDETVYEQYRDYRGLQGFLDDFLARNGIKETISHPQIQSKNSTSGTSSGFYKTRILRRHRFDFTPVMGIMALSNDVANMIYDLPDEKGQMIGIFGKWGRGKTFLLNELWKVMEFQKGKEYIKVEYHAWKYQETPASWAYLYELLSDKYLGKHEWGNWRNYYFRLIKLNLKRVGWLPLAKLALALAITLTGMILSLYLEFWLYSLASISILAILLATYGQQLKKEFSTKATDLIRKYSIRHSFKDSMGIQADIQDELIKLLKVWIPDTETCTLAGKKYEARKILLIVEDLDRCAQERIIQNIDALRVMLEDDEIVKRLIIVTAIDERILKSAIRTKYKSLASSREDKDADMKGEKQPFNESVVVNELISEYLDKLFISAIKLGALTGHQKEEYLKELIKKEIDAEDLNKPESTESADKREHTAIASSTHTGVFAKPESSLDLAIRNGDLDIKDGDFAMEDDSGNLISTKDLENMEEERNAPSDSWKNLTRTEINFLNETIRTWQTSTPRRISIFYYRYLLCKNLLINRYIFLKRRNRWEDFESTKMLLLIIRYFSDLYDPEAIVTEKERVGKLPDSNEQMSMELHGLTFYKSKNDYLYLLEILELIIAY